MPSFTCAVCLDDHPATRQTRILLPKGEDICASCFVSSLVPQFWDSIHHPANFPVHWGSTPLRFQNSAQHIPAYTEMLKAFFLRRGELETEPRKRVYCLGKGCEEYLGPQKEQKGYELEDVYVCDVCFCHVCSWCKKGAEPGHVCGAAETQEKKKEEEEEIPGLEKGKDYLLCPGCDAPCMLADGCNSLKCRCKVEFCACCNEKVKHGDKEHWQPGKPCPRFGQPGDPRALYDDQVRIIEDNQAAAAAAAAAAAPAARAAEDVRWARLFSERPQAARRRLHEMNEFLEMEIGRTRFFSRLRHSFLRMQNFVLKLSQNYGLFHVDENNPGAAFPDLNRFDAYENHQEILQFMDAEGGNGLDAQVADHAWSTLPQLFDLATWYVNHVKIEMEERELPGGVFRVRFFIEHGNPELDRPFEMADVAGVAR